MLEKILRKITNNLGFKILAILFSFALWLMVYNINDPVKIRTYTVNVEMKNTEFITNMGKWADIKDGANTVTFSVTAKKTVIDKMRDDDFVATADFSEAMISEDEKTAAVPIKIESKRYNNQLKYSSQVKYVDLALEKLKTKQFVISANTTGTVAQGYALGNVKVETPTVLKVSGPYSEVKKVHSVVATIDVGNMKIDISDSVKPKLYDSAGKEIKTDKLSLSNNQVVIRAEILKTKQLNVQMSNPKVTNGQGAEVSLVPEPKTIVVKGREEKLKEIEKIVIPSNALDASNVTTRTDTYYDIKGLLPEGIALVNAKESKIAVHMYMNGQEEQSVTLTVPTSNIKISGLDTSKYQASFANSNVVTKVTASPELISQLNVDAITASADLSGMGVGSHNVKIKFNLDSSQYEYSDVTLQVVIKTISQSQSNNNSSAGTTDSGNDGNSNNTN
ncbi:YbbR-like domain-containing protein [Lachnobacterium bovis]|uniref:CdaR family protein n=1 Tax=Lachnobacterium bovis TaxID=140626 RepID=UPI00048B324B|nr:CdaR family protein [Lachnobacterium bovis]